MTFAVLNFMMLTESVRGILHTPPRNNIQIQTLGPGSRRRRRNSPHHRHTPHLPSTRRLRPRVPHYTCACSHGSYTGSEDPRTSASAAPHAGIRPISKPTTSYLTTSERVQLPRAGMQYIRQGGGMVQHPILLRMGRRRKHRVVRRHHRRRLVPLQSRHGRSDKPRQRSWPHTHPEAGR
jgi:hypothetical protein